LMTMHKPVGQSRTSIHRSNFLSKLRNIFEATSRLAVTGISFKAAPNDARNDCEACAKNLTSRIGNLASESCSQLKLTLLNQLIQAA